VVVVGGGPAGLAAAAAAGQVGAEVVLLEERAELGGQLRYRVQPIITDDARNGERPIAIAHRLAAAAMETGAELRTGALAAGCFPGLDLLVVENGRASRVAADALVLSTGSTDLPYPFAGSTLPGVFSARGLQMLLHVHQVRPGARFAVIGGGAEAEELIGDIQLAGGEVVWGGIAPAPFLRAMGSAVVTGFAAGQEEHEVDVIAIAVGRRPDTALAAMAGVPLAFAAALGGPTPIVDDRMESPLPRFFVAGDAAGTGSVATAIAEGRIAGTAAAHAAGLVGDEAVAAAVAAGGAELAWRAGVRRSVAPVFAQPYE
jgi:thioredoxin reductase